MLSLQRQQAGTEAEVALATAMDKNTSIVKFSLHVRDANSRNRIDRAVSRNAELGACLGHNLPSGRRYAG
jgi:hypothetical protein